MSFGAEESSSECVAGFIPAWKAYMSGIGCVKTAGSDGTQQRRDFTLSGVVLPRQVFNGRSNDWAKLGVSWELVVAQSWWRWCRVLGVSRLRRVAWSRKVALGQRLRQQLWDQSET